MLHRFERQLPRSTIVTVNVDRLHQRAGNKNVIEMYRELRDRRVSR